MKKKMLWGMMIVVMLFSVSMNVWAMPKGEIVIATHTFGSEDWLGPMRSSTENYISMAIYNSLLTRDNKTGQITAGQGGLAQAFEMTEDAMTFTFELAKGAQFHDGWGEVTAEDVKYSFELSMLDASTNDAAGVFRDSIKSIEIVNPHKLVVHMKTPGWDFANYLTSSFQYQAIVCKKYVEKVGKEQAGRHPIGSNSFKFKEHAFGDHITVEAVENHWYKTPEVKNITWKKVPEPATRLAMLKAGEAHLTQIVYDQIKEAEQAGLTVKPMTGVTQPAVHLFGQYLNATYKPEERPPWAKGEWWDLNSPAYKVRRALSLAIDREAIVKSVLHGYGTTEGATAFAFFPGSPGFNTAAKVDPYDPDKATKLLKEAGYARPSDLEVTADLTPHAARPYNKPIMEAVAMMWESLGIKVKTRMATDYPSLMGDTADRHATYSWCYAAPYMGSAYSLLKMLTSSTDYLSYVGESPELDKLMSDIHTAKTITARTQAHAAVAKYLDVHVPTITVCYAANLYATAPNLVWPNKPGQAGVLMHNFEYMHFK